MRQIVIVSALLVALPGCAQTPRIGMVADSGTGLMYGSTIENNLVTDPSFYRNRKIKVRTRNTSGDRAFGLTEFTDSLNRAYADKGYEPTGEDDFGLILDINVMYSGHIQHNSATSFSFLGAASGQIYGARSKAAYGRDMGLISGATLGSIIGSHVTEDTYMIIARVTFGSIKKTKGSKRTVTFSRSKKLKNIDDPDEDERVYNRGFKKSYTTRLAVYAGGTNVTQSQIIEEVRKRMIRIVADYL